MIESGSLWKDGRPMNDQDGNAGERASYDESGNLVATELLDAAVNPSMSRNSVVSRFTCRYDERGNCVEPVFGMLMAVRFIAKDRSNFLSFPKIASRRAGNVVGGACLMANGQPVLSWQNIYDADDRPIEGTFFDHTGHPAVGPFGWFQ